MKKKRGTLALVSLGCAKNAVDLQVMAGNLLKEGWSLSPDPDCADVVIVNTCSFIASAREEAEAEILRAIELKKIGRYGKVVVAGCYPQRYPELKGAFPGVDEWGGVPKDWIEPKMPALRLTGKAFAYLKIAEGCAHRCAYCAIPLIRGKYRSRPLRSILKEARSLVATGCREINVIAQDPMLWREGKKSLPDLLWALDKIPGDFWVRVLYSYPSEISEDFLVWMLTSKHAVRYIDVPLQHTVPEVLEKMNRKAAIADSLAAAEFLRDVVPGITLRTTIMTGFPGETEARFRKLMDRLPRRDRGAFQKAHVRFAAHAVRPSRLLRVLPGEGHEGRGARREAFARRRAREGEVGDGSREVDMEGALEAACRRDVPRACRGAWRRPHGVAGARCRRSDLY